MKTRAFLRYELTILLFVLLPFSIFAQYSGTYSIGSSGTWTSFNEAVDSLQSQGITGAVTIEVDSGTYTEQVVIDSIAGTSASNTITFIGKTGNASDVLLQHTAASGSGTNYCVLLQDAVRINFKHISFKKATATYSRVIVLSGGVRYIGFDSCSFEGNSVYTSSSNYAVIASGSMAQDSAISFTNSTFVSGSYAIWYSGLNNSNRTIGFTFSGNTIEDVRFDAVRFDYIQDLVVSGNSISTPSNYYMRMAIFLNNQYHCEVSNNSISSSNGEYGIYLSSIFGASSTRNSVINNQISLNYTSTSHGIYLISSDYTDVYFNSVYLGSSTNGSSYGMVVYNGTDSSWIKNNIFYNSGAGYALYVYGGTYWASNVLDHNDLYTTGSNLVYVNNGAYAGAYPDLLSWQGTASDSNSISVNPYYSAFGDLHASNAYLDGAGVSISGITTDFEGDGRGTPPCIGADEFTAAAVSPMKGVYTIDSTGSGPRNFQSFSKAIAALDTFGIDSVVEFVVASDTFHERVELRPVNGASASNTILFRSAARDADSAMLQDLNSSGSNNNYALWLRNCDYVTFKHLSFKKATSGNSTVVLLSGNTTYISFDSCAFEGYDIYTSGSNYAVIHGSGMTNDTAINISNSSIKSGSMAFRYYGENTSNRTQGLTFTGNTITDPRYYGVILGNIQGLEITGNTISTPLNNYLDDGIHLSGSYDFTVSNNKVELSNGYIGIYLDNNAGSASVRNQVIHNRVSVNRASTSFGIYLYGSDYTDVYFNSMFMGSSTNSNSYALLVHNYTDSARVKNNILYNSGAGYALYVYGGTYWASNVLDYNDLYTTGSNLVYVNNGAYTGAYVSLPSWQSTGSDSNSIGVNPYYSAFDDLHASNAYLDGAGVSISGITNDFEGDVRGTPPCIGADEFISVPVTPMKGIYTIDSAGSGPRNFQSFSKAVAALDTFGIDSVVEFVVASDTFHERVELRPVNGASATNTILFRSAARDADSTMLEDLVASSGQNYSLFLNSVDHVTFKHIKFKKNTVSYSGVVCFSGNVTFITFDSCAFEGYNADGTYYNIVWSTGIAGDSSITFSNSTFINGSSALTYTGQSTLSRTVGIQVLDNTFIGTNVTALSLNYVQDALVLRNQFSSSKGSTVGITVLNAADVVIAYNQLELTSCSNGINLSGVTVANASRNLIHHNMISVDYAGQSTGIYLSSANYVDLYFNSVGQGSQTNSNSAALRVQNGCYDLTAKNNIFSAFGSGMSMYHYGYDWAHYEADNNDYYTTGSTKIYVYTGTAAGTYTDAYTFFRAFGTDSNSIGVNPFFVSSTDLHAQNAYLDNAGTPISGYTDDIDGDVRSNPPCIGADEFAVPAVTPMNGTYTIDSTGSGSRNFLSFVDAILALDTFGVDGSVEFVVASDTFYQQVEFEPIIGASEANTITFRSASRNAEDVVLATYDATIDNRYTVTLRHTDHIIFKHIRFENRSATYRGVIKMEGTISDLLIDSCIIMNVSALTASADLSGINANTQYDSNVVVSNSKFINCSYGIYYIGYSSGQRAHGIRIINDSFIDFGHYGVYVQSTSDLTIASNYFNTSLTGFKYGIGLNYCNDYSITKNSVIAPIAGVRGIDLSYADGTSSDRCLVANNMVSVNSNAAYGIDVNASNYIDFYHNSVYLGSSAGTGSIAVYNNGNNNVYKNNIFENGNTGYAIYLNAAATSDYNDLYTSGTNLGYLTGSNYTSLAAWQGAGQGANSINVTAGYTSTTNLHASTTDLYAAGDAAVKSTVPDDIDGDLRSASQPTIGADEFTPNYDNDLAIYEVVSPTTECGLTKVPVIVKIKNWGNTSEDTLAVAYQFNGGSLVEDTLFYSLGPDEIVTFQLQDSVDATGLSSFTFKVFTALATDSNAANDTSSATYSNYAAWSHTLTNDTSICYGSNIILQATGANYYSWSNGRTTSYNNVNIYSDVSYSVIMENLLGCHRYDTVNISVLARPTFSFVNEPGFTNSYCDPDVANSATDITFKIRYSNSDNTPPASGYPYIQLDANNNYVYDDFTDLSFGTIADDAGDTNYVDGKSYTVTTTLPEYSFYHSRFYAVSQDGCAYGSGSRSEPLIDDDRVDLRIWANDISFSDFNPDTGEVISITAKVHNPSNYASGTFLVALYEEDSLIATTRVEDVAANSDTSITWYHSYPIDEFYPMKVVVDSLDEVDEDNENNNFAIRPVFVGDYTTSASINLQANYTDSTPCSGTYVAYYGHAEYDSVASADKRVQGATVEFEINETGVTYQGYTNSNGDVSISFRAPTATGTYTISGTITDYTLISTFEDTFEVVNCYNPYDIAASIVLDSSIIVVGDSCNGTVTFSNVGDSTVYGFYAKAYSNHYGQIIDTLIDTLAPGQQVQHVFKQVFTIIGTYSASAVADYTHKYSERNESNNYAVDHVRVLDSLPDIVPYAGHNYTNDLSTPYTFSYIVTNYGGVSTGLFYTVVYDSTPGGRVLMDRDTFTNLNRLSSKGRSHVYSLSTSTCHNLIVEADTFIATGGIVHESKEDNNWDDITVCHNPPDTLPDLFTASGYLEVQPVVPEQAGDSLYLSAKFFNCGTGDIPSGDTIRITYDVFVAGSLDTTITEDYLGGLAKNANATSLVLHQVPPFGDNLLRVTLDIQDSITELNELNNQAQYPLCWDFDINYLESGGTHYVNDLQSLAYTYGNEGLYYGRDVKVRITIDDTNTIVQNKAYVAPTGRRYKGYTSSIPYSGSFKHTFTTIGWHKIKVEIDADSTYIECDETNNVDSGWIYISGLKSDLRILSHMIAPTELNPDTNELVSVYLSFENIGKVSTDSIVIKCMVNDSALGSLVKVPGLEPGEDTTILVDEQWADSVNRTSVIRGILDPDNLIDETDTLNNIASRAIIVGASTNLRIIDIDYDVSPCNNIEDNRDVIVTVINEGANANQADIGLRFNFHAAPSSIPIMKTDVVFAIGDTVVLTYTDALPPSYIVGTNEVFTYGFITNVEEPEFNTFDNDYSDTLCVLDLETSIVTNEVNCYGSADGSVAVELIYYKEYAGDNFIYSYQHVDSSEAMAIHITDSYQDTLSGLGGGIYVLTAWDGSGRMVEDTFTIVEHAALDWIGVVDTTQCAGGVALDISGGVPVDTTIVGPDTTFYYNTVWTAQNASNTIPAPNAEDLEKVAPGTYHVLITDRNGCTGRDTFTVNYVLNSIADTTIALSNCAMQDSTGWTTVLTPGTRRRIVAINDVLPDSSAAGVLVPADGSADSSIYGVDYAGRVIAVHETDTAGVGSFTVRLYYFKNELDSLIAQSDSLNQLSDVVVHRYDGANINLSIGDNLMDSTYWHQHTPTIDSFDNVYVMEVVTPGFGEFYLSYAMDSTLNSNPVPVELLSFEAVAAGEDALLHWVTATELNNSHFVVERSMNAREWTAIGRVDGQGTTVALTNYEFVDPQAASKGHRLYYRLQQVDFDGSAAYSEVRTVQFETERTLRIYPLPADELVHLEMAGEWIHSYTLFDEFGHEVKHVDLQDPSNTVEVDLRDLTVGVYYIEVRTDHRTRSERVMIVR